MPSRSEPSSHHSFLPPRPIERGKATDSTKPVEDAAQTLTVDGAERISSACAGGLIVDQPIDEGGREGIPGADGIDHGNSDVATVDCRTVSAETEGFEP